MFSVNPPPADFIGTALNCHEHPYIQAIHKRKQFMDAFVQTYCDSRCNMGSELLNKMTWSNYQLTMLSR